MSRFPGGELTSTLGWILERLKKLEARWEQAFSNGLLRMDPTNPPTVGPGAWGPPGPPGLDGPEGPQGEAGPPGSGGGAAGAPGATGAQGPGGPPGSDGQDGEPGEEGPPGNSGADGSDGATGSQGPEGPPGSEGEQGEPGEGGPPGPAGEAGAAGPSGEGVEDVDLLHVLSLASAGNVTAGAAAYAAGGVGYSRQVDFSRQTLTHMRIIAYAIDGDDTAGTKGLRYTDTDGNELCSVEWATTGIAWYTGAWTAISETADQQIKLEGKTPDGGVITGYEIYAEFRGLVSTGVGPRGAPGTDGEDGADGPMGPPGSAGPPGEAGAAGEPGADGPPGNDGADGVDGDPGPPGEGGADGAAGAAGPAGAMGPPGEDGEDGEQGPPGVPGSAHSYRYLNVPDAAPTDVVVAGDAQGAYHLSGPVAERALKIHVLAKTAPGASGLPVTWQYNSSDDLDTESWTTIGTYTLSSEKSNSTESMTNAIIPANRLIRTNWGTIVGSPADAQTILLTVPIA